MPRLYYKPFMRPGNHRPHSQAPRTWYYNINGEDGPPGHDPKVPILVGPFNSYDEAEASVKKFIQSLQAKLMGGQSGKA